jgi:hypothetical protein
LDWRQVSTSPFSYSPEHSSDPSNRIEDSQWMGSQSRETTKPDNMLSDHD